MSLGDMWRDLAPEIGRVLGSTSDHPERGERVVLHRPSTLEDVGEDAVPRELEVIADAAMGDAALVLGLASGGSLAGTLLTGSRISIGAESHILTADAAASGPSVTVAVAPALTSNVAEGTTLTLYPEAVFTFENCHISRRLRRDLARPLQADSMATVFVPAKDAPTVPRINDVLMLEDGTVGRVANEIISKGAFWKLQMGG